MSKWHPSSKAGSSVQIVHGCIGDLIAGTEPDVYRVREIVYFLPERNLTFPRQAILLVYANGVNPDRKTSEAVADMLKSFITVLCYSNAAALRQKGYRISCALVFTPDV